MKNIIKKYGIYIIDTNNNSIKFISENNDKLVIENRKI